jgi:hypothetical protein
MASFVRATLAGVTALTFSFLSMTAAAVPLVPNSGWQEFIWTDGLGYVESPVTGYQLTLTEEGTIDLVDCCIIGDQFELLILNLDNQTQTTLTTSAIDLVLDGTFSDAYEVADADLAWADPRLSKGSLMLGAGAYQIDINVIRAAANLAEGGTFPNGQGFIRVSSIPIPAAVWLFGSGLGLLGWFRRKAT